MSTIIYNPNAEIVLSPTLLGGKAHNLARLAEYGYPVPTWFAVTTQSLDGVLSELPSNTSPKEIRDHLLHVQLPEHLQEELRLTLSSLGMTDSLLAIRSSAIGEDSGGLSYAGQLESYLFVRPEELPDYVLKVWASAFSDRVVSYREHNGLDGKIPGVAVIVQKMIDPQTSGVAFGIDPVSGEEDVVVISSTYGIGEGLVSGLLNADRFRVRGEEIEHHVVEKDQAVRFDLTKGSGTRVEDVPDDLQTAPSLKHEEVLRVAEMTRSLGNHFNSPQDVEWGIAEGKLYLLQTRPVTAIAAKGKKAIDLNDLRGERIVWDNSNIIESYSGVTTPLTFSFIDNVYTEVYKEFTRILGVKEETIRANSRVFSMLGLLRGRVYYNLLNWYRVLALLPGYRINARFMEGMMGVKEPLEEEPEIIPPRGNPYIRLTLSLYRLVVNFIRLPKKIEEFQSHLNRTLGPLEGKKFSDNSPEELIAHYHHLQRELLQRWRTPILNDFYTMIFHGILKKMIESWELSGGETLHNDLLIGEGGIISTEPMRMLREIGSAIRADKELAALLQAQPPKESPFLLDQMQRHPYVGPMLNAYLDRFGDRYAGELRLETVTPKEEPELVVGIVQQYAGDKLREVEAGESVAEKIRREAEERVATYLKGKPLKRRLFRFVLKWARERIRNRENLRFERTRLFGVVRQLFLGIGDYFVQYNLLKERRDIFYLGVDEIFSLVKGTALSADPRGVVQARKEEFARYTATASPPDRFETFGTVSLMAELIHNAEQQPASGSREGGTTLEGIPCCPGTVTAPVRIVTDPTAPVELRGCILVAERTDPGWGPLFPLASGLLVERGSLLSHSAIVAREMGIPAVVAIPNLLRELQDGEIVTMDGAKGTVIRRDQDLKQKLESEEHE
ncbi:MAG: PEP/pyruvate-binding domain-containing protein [Candidatus Kapaibacterium sp.]